MATQTRFSHGRKVVLLDHRAGPQSLARVEPWRIAPALVAEYQTKLPDKKLLRAKLHEFYLQNSPDE